MMLGRIQALVSDTTSGVYYREGKNHQVPDFLSRYHAPQISEIMAFTENKDYKPPYHKNFYRSIPKDEYGPTLEQPIAFT